jgi:protein MpaA
MIQRFAFVALMIGMAGCAHEAAREAVVTPVTPVPVPPPPPASRPVTPMPPALRETTTVLGTSVEGRPIRMHVFGSGPRTTLVLGAIHGSEPTSHTVVQRLLEYLRAHPVAFEGERVAIIPVANPDGLERRMRTNKNLVDINRNFPAKNWAKTRRGIYFGGERAASEPETQALLRAFELVSPARVISVHSMDKPCNNFDGPSKALAEAMAEHNGYAVKANIGYPTPGSFGTWAGIDRKVPIVTLELPRSMPGERAWEQNRAALLAAIGAGD